MGICEPVADLILCERVAFAARHDGGIRCWPCTSRTGSSSPDLAARRRRRGGRRRAAACGSRRGRSTSAGSVVGLVAAFMFAVQMLNFPVANGTSGHLLGGVLAAVLVGPSPVLLPSRSCSPCRRCCSPTAAVGARAERRQHGADRGVRRLRHLPRLPSPARTLDDGRSRVAAGLAAFTAPVLAPMAFTSSTPSAATTTCRSDPSPAAMIGVHVLIGIGEGIITALAVGSVMAMRPDLVYGARGLARAAGRTVAGARVG